MAELHGKQIAAARLLASDPLATKEGVAEALGIGRRTIFRWMHDPLFTRKIEEFRQSSLAKADPNMILSLLSEKEKQTLLEKLLNEQDREHLPELRELEEKILSIDDWKRKTDAVEQVELLRGRLRLKVLGEDCYNQDGSSKTGLTTQEALDERIRKLKDLVRLTSPSEPSGEEHGT